jgi:hypothetical protein
MRIAIATLGCKINQYDSAVIHSRMEARHSFVPFDEQADCYVINSCTVTDRADWEARQLVRRAKRLNPAAKVLVTGCYAQVSPEEVSGISGVDYVVGLNRLEDLVHFVEATPELATKIAVSDVKRAGAWHQGSAGAHARFSQSPRGLQLCLHLLHHSDGARTEPQRRAAGSDGAGAAASRRGIQRNRPNRHSSRRLWARSQPENGSYDACRNDR